MTTIDPRDIVAAATDRSEGHTAGTLEVIEYRRSGGAAIRRALLIRDIDGLLSAAGMPRQEGKDD